jgi:DNA topoisomerase-1
LRELGPFESAAEAKRNVVAAIAKVAAELGNTPSVCRKCYVHPAVLEAYLGGITIADAKEKLDDEIAEHAAALRREELALLKLLEQRALLEKASSKPKKTQRAQRTQR